MTDISSEPQSGVENQRPSHPLLRMVIVVLSTVAMLVAAYLLFTSLSKSGQPLGCGEQSGCAEVLTSRWSQVFGVPVSLPAGLTYLGIIGATLALPRLERAHNKVVHLLTVLALVLILAAVWFVGLQVFYLKAICPWCMTEHGLGLVVGIVALILATRHLPTQSLTGASLTAAALLSVFIAAQALGPYQAPTADRIAANSADSDLGFGASREVALLDGKFKIRPGQLPTNGSPDAENLIVVLFDYCCPHCRATHGYLSNAVKKYPTKLAFVSLPSPLNSDCNPHWAKTKKRFLESCELAKLALAVYKTAPERFSQFDTWLFEPERPRKLSEAILEAEKLVGAQTLATAIDDPWIQQQLKSNTTAYHDSQAERLPVLLSPGFASVVGRPGSEEEFRAILKQDFQLGDD